MIVTTVLFSVGFLFAMAGGSNLDSNEMKLAAYQLTLSLLVFAAMFWNIYAV